ncbi:hypothetical protein MGYG_04546 [Nannizzia gypsea CBS 118893]|uniref:Myb-like domain-containing protein n=1 Tax=Arthroderma gypseum (strain ATCC MYA-4604 / CBS 118893) TaxID=535722 RepID=E4UTQ1_ARTGP|nr:hypothetical protein MGYG_04546 [Nannizzia gypsea CBS 118893]EFR01544.1 hypothetical protein MGYG_04546 [Nannizzia gypsea CBS 118893]
MPPKARNVPGQGIRMSFGDVFKSSKALKAERELVARKTAQLKAENKRLADLHAAMAPYTMEKQAKDGSSPATTPPSPPGPPPAAAAAPPPPVLPPGTVPQKPGASAVPVIEVRDWTDEDDAQLKKLKEDNISWRKIAETMRSSVHELKERWRVIRPEPAKQPQPEPEKVKEDSPQEKKAVVVEPSAKEKKGKEAPKVVYTDESLSTEEAVLLSKLADKYDREMWLRISSKFFDKTGKRLDPDEARRHIRPS